MSTIHEDYHFVVNVIQHSDNMARHYEALNNLIEAFILKHENRLVSIVIPLILSLKKKLRLMDKKLFT